MRANAQPTSRPSSSPPHPIQFNPPGLNPPLSRPSFSPNMSERGSPPEPPPSERRSPPNPPRSVSRTWWSQRQSFTTHENPQRQAASDIPPSTYIPFPRQGIRTAAVCAHPRAGIPKSQIPNEKIGRRRSFRWPVCATGTTRRFGSHFGYACALWSGMWSAQR